GSLGMVLPLDLSPLDLEAWGIVISYVEEGHVADQDAGRLDADRLLARAREIVPAENAPLVDLGFPAVELAGWIEPPRYERASSQLVGARELRCVDAELPTLIYSVRILGRTGVLVLDAVATADRLPAIREAVDALRRSIAFKPGHA